jgi:hypothetical protein
MASTIRSWLAAPLLFACGESPLAGEGESETSSSETAPVRPTPALRNFAELGITGDVTFTGAYR